MKKILRWLDQNILTLLTGILIVVIPLYPKIPLSDLIEGYIVRLRLEDILILFTCLVWGVQLLRRKIKFPSTLVAKLIMAYLAVAVLSSLSAIFLTKTVPLFPEHLFKLALHLFRRFEYFSLFFIAYSGVRNRRDLINLLKTGFVTLVLVVLYGFGQKYLYWPAFSTMNREFSKGIRLYLSPTSRVMSTFGGHYDYGAYLMMLLSFLVSSIWLVKRRAVKIGLAVVALMAYWSFILTASRTSFIGYLGGITAIAVILVKFRGFKWSLRQWFMTMVISMVIMIFFGDLSARFYQFINSAERIHQFIPWMETGKIEEKIFEVKDRWYSLQAWQRNWFNPTKPKPPQNAISTDELAIVAVPSDIPSPSNLYPRCLREGNRVTVSTSSTATKLPAAAAKRAQIWSLGGHPFGRSGLAPSKVQTQSALRYRVFPLTKTFNDEFTRQSRPTMIICACLRDRIAWYPHIPLDSCRSASFGLQAA
jgi:hypothetical protein